MKKIMALLALFAVLASAPGFAQAGNADPVIKLETTMGDIVIRLNERKAPITCANFVQYVKSGHYDGTIFHRVIKDFMIQGGGFADNMKEKPTHAPIRNEANNGLKNEKYTIAMARTKDPHSARAQFFINTRNNNFLDFKSQKNGEWGYAVFGKVIQGQNVVNQIEKAATGRRAGHDDVPTEPVIIKKAVVLEQ